MFLSATLINNTFCRSMFRTTPKLNGLKSRTPEKQYILLFQRYMLLRSSDTRQNYTTRLLNASSLYENVIATSKRQRQQYKQEKSNNTCKKMRMLFFVFIFNYLPPDSILISSNLDCNSELFQYLSVCSNFCIFKTTATCCKHSRCSVQRLKRILEK